MPHLVPAEVVDDHHADKVHQHTQDLEGEYGHAQGAVASSNTGRVILAVGTALLTGQAVAGRPLGQVRTPV